MSEQCSCGHTDINTRYSDKPINIAPKRTSRVQRIHRSRPFERFVEALEQDGCVIVQDFVNPQIPAQVESAESKCLEAFNDDGDDEFRGRESPLDLNEMIRESLFADTLYQTLATHFLTLETIAWRSKNIDLKVSKPRTFRSTTRDLNNRDENDNHISSFHRADSPLHKRHTATTRYDYQSRRDTTLTLLVPELDSLSGSIPIHVIPGSHLWDDQKPDISRGVKDIELHAGEAMILLGSLYHAIGDQRISSASKPSIYRTGSFGSGSGASLKEKLLHDMSMCSGVYRPEDQIIAEDDDE